MSAPNAVEIVVHVTDANSGAAVAGVTQNLDKLGASGSGAAGKVAALTGELSNLGRVGPPALHWSRQAFQDVGQGAEGGVEKVRLLREELGIHVPRAMESMIAKNELLMSGISKLGALMAGFGFAGIAVAFGTEAINGIQAVWDHYQGVTKTLQEYNDQLEKTREQEFGDTHSIETTRDRINEASDATKKFTDQAQAAQRVVFGWRSLADGLFPGAGQMWQSWHQQTVAKGLAGQATSSMGQTDTLTGHSGEQTHEQRELALQLTEAQDALRVAQMSPGAQAKARHDNSIAEGRARAAEERQYNNELDKSHGKPIAPDAGAEKETQENKIAQLKADAELYQAQREHADELRRLHEEAIESGLKGTALLRQQELAAIEELKQQGMATPQAINDVHEKFHNQEMQRLKEQNLEVNRMRQDAALTGMTGVDRIKQEGANKLSDIYRNDAGLNPGQMLAEVKAVNDQTAAQIAELNKSFSQRVDEVVGQSANRELQGFARIRSEAQQQIVELRQEFKDKGGNPADLNRGIGAINQGAAGQAADLTRQNQEQTEEIESEARAKFMSAEKQQTAAIESEYTQRLEKYKEQLDAQEISQDDYNRRVAAAGQEANAQMIQAATEAREKMAHEFDSFFQGMEHPLKYFQSLGEKVAGQAAAAMVQRFQQRGGTGTGQGGHGGTFLGGILGGFGLGGPAAHGVPGMGIPAANHTGMAASTLSVSSATIYVGNAMIQGGGGVGVPSSTSFHAAGASGFSGGFAGSGTSSFGGGSFGGGSTSSSSSSPGFSMPAAAGGHGGGVLGTASQGMGLFSQARGIFGKHSSTNSGNDSLETITDIPKLKLGKDGSEVSSSGGTGMLNGGGFANNALGAAGGALGVFSAYEGNGGAGGALSGAMSGMQLGMALGGPIGAAIGAAGGAILGAIGMGGREKARVYDLRTVKPQIAGDMAAYQQGGMDYLTAYSDIEQLQSSSAKATDQMGPAAQSYYQDTIKPEIKEAMGKLTQQQRAGRSMYTASAASYDVGADSVPRDGFAMIHQDERIIPSDQNERITSALEKQTMPVQGGFSGDVHVHLHAIDAQSGASFLMQNKHVIRGAVNESLAENSGGGM